MLSAVFYESRDLSVLLNQFENVLRGRLILKQPKVRLPNKIPTRQTFFGFSFGYPNDTDLRASPRAHVSINS